MIKAAFAGLAGLGAALALFQLRPEAREANAPPSPDASTAAAVPEGGADASTASATPDGGALAVPAPAPDAGLRVTASADGATIYVGDLPGRLRTENDGGAPDAGAASAGASSAAEAQEVRRLRERVTILEQQLARSNSDAQTRQIDELNRQVAALRDQLAQEQARRQSEELAAQKARANEQAAVTALSTAQQQLASGDSRVLEQLESASGSLPAPAQGAVQSAKAAVQSGDLAAARYWLSIAITQTQRQQTSQPVKQ